MTCCVRRVTCLAPESGAKHGGRRTPGLRVPMGRHDRHDHLVSGQAGAPGKVSAARAVFRDAGGGVFRLLLIQELLAPISIGF